MVLQSKHYLQPTGYSYVYFSIDENIFHEYISLYFILKKALSFLPAERTIISYCKHGGQGNVLRTLPIFVLYKANFEGIAALRLKNVTQ